MTVTPKLPRPDRMSSDDWIVYLRASIKRETGSPWKAATWEIKDWSRRLKDSVSGVDSFVMALSIDIMVMNWGYEKTLSPQRALSHTRLLRWYYDMRRPYWFWRAVWFSRYAETQAEVEYYREWLSQAEIALDTGEGRDGKKDLMKLSRDKLHEAEQIITARNMSPTFQLNWLGLQPEQIKNSNV